MIIATYYCGDCDATATAQIRQHFQSLFGDKGYGFGYYVVDNVKDVAPEGWMALDAIGATYCPDCWASITDDEREVEQP